MSATNYPQFNAAVSELTTRVEGLISRVHETETYHNIERSDLAAQSAEASADSAQTSANSATASAATATTKATQASASAASAATSAATATTKAAEATSSATSASASLDKANKWAEAAENTTVEAGKYSAKHHAAKAAASAATASTKASEAAASATSATGSANTATTKATESAASAASASTSAATATTKATEASTSASSAGSSAASASTKASEAAASAATATTKATQAASSATAAGSSAASASTKATEAANSASSASSSATSATASAATATTKATEAASSATAALGSKNSAEKWANEPENVAVETGKYSARHHAAKAAASATTSSTKATEAAASATEAAGYRDQAMSAAASMTGSLAELGSVDLSSNAYPAKPVTAGFWKVTVGGVVGGVDYGVGDTLVYSKNLDQFYKIDNTESVTSSDPRLTDAREWTGATVTQAEAEAGTGTTRRAWTAQRVRQAVVSWWNGVTSAFGRGFVASADAAAGRAALELGTAASRNVTTTPVDSGADLLMKVGDFGVGSIGGNLSGELNNAPAVNAVINSSDSLPADWTLPGSFPQGFNLWRSGNVKAQLLVSYGTAGVVGFRHGIGSGVWSPFKQLWDSSTLLNIGASASSARAALELGTAATAAAQTYLVDTTPNSLMRVGAGGLLGDAIARNSIAGVESLRKTEFFSTNAGGSSPYGYPGIGAHINWAGGYGIQLYGGVLEDKIGFRRQSAGGGAWTAPVYLYHTSNLLNIGTTAAAARAALELGTAATATITTSTRDSTLNRVLKVGDFNLAVDSMGSAAVLDANTLTSIGFYYLGGSSANVPIPISGYLEVVGTATGRCSQIYRDVTLGRTYSRTMFNSVWGSWRQVYTQDTILGAVSQSGGIPTGAIIERGSNANGEYVRFADGTQFAFNNALSTDVAIDVSMVGGFRSAGITWAYPVAFVGGVQSVYFCAGDLLHSGASVSAIASAQAVGVLLANASQPAQPRITRCFAVGRWN